MRRVDRAAARARSGVAGFTLVEVLVAMTIAAIALMAAMRAGASLALNSAELRDRIYAQWAAENRLAMIRVAREFPAPGQRQFDCSQGSVELICREQVFQTPNAQFRRVEIGVFRVDSTHRLARLVSFATQRR